MLEGRVPRDRRGGQKPSASRSSALQKPYFQRSGCASGDFQGVIPFLLKRPILRQKRAVLAAKPSAIIGLLLLPVRISLGPTRITPSNHQPESQRREAEIIISTCIVIVYDQDPKVVWGVLENSLFLR